MNENEIWLPIEGYDNYQVSNLGKVKSLKFDKEKILSQWKNNNGYLMVVLCKEGKRKNYYTHRLIAETFIANPNNLPCVNHKDENPLNNQVDNLEWCTYQYNSNYRTCQQRRVEKTDWKSVGRKNAEKLSRQVYQYTKDGELIKIWESTQECGRNEFDQGHVSKCCLGKQKTHRGYIWSYEELKKQD